MKNGTLTRSGDIPLLHPRPMLITILHILMLITINLWIAELRAEVVRTDSQAGITYYVSPNGNDANTGRSAESPWRTLARVKQAGLGPGTRIHLHGGQTFVGDLSLTNGECGTANEPTVITTYGHGLATIKPGRGNGISVINCGGYEISNLAIHGSNGNIGAGILFRTELRNKARLEHVYIDNVWITGFRYGINIVARHKLSGFRDVRITNSTIHNNVRDGIRIVGRSSTRKIGWDHQDVYISNNVVHSNFGDPNYHKKYSGSGIEISDVNRAIIEYNIAHSNGGRGTKGTGPVGIWAWECNDVTIQFNESHGNRASTDGYDADGFDLDGGCGNSVMQYNYSHDNDGAGFLVWQYPGARRKANVTVRYNISVNDGRKNGYGGITIGGSAMEGVRVYNNTIYMSPSPTGNGYESGVAMWNDTRYWNDPKSQVNDVVIANNIFVSADGSLLARIISAGTNLIFVNNNYYTPGGEFQIEYLNEVRYESLKQWRSATGQERLNGRSYGLVGSPHLRNFGKSASEYRLRPDSPLIDSGLDLHERFGFQPGSTDFFGSPLPQGRTYDIGAHELISDK